MQPKKWMTALVGIAAGILSGLFGVGALLAAYVSRITDTGSGFKANISVVFLTENVFRLLLYAMLGMITPAVLKSALLLMPAMLASLFAGIAVSRQNQRPYHQKAGAGSPHILRHGFDFAEYRIIPFSCVPRRLPFPKSG